MRLAWWIGVVATAALAVVSSVASPASAAIDMATVRGDAARTGSVAGGPVPPLTRAWTYTLGGEDMSPTQRPLVAAGSVFVTTDKVTALDARTGAVRWSRPFAAAGLAFDAGRLFVQTPGAVTAVDPASGATLWSRALPWPADGGSTPVAAEGRVFAVHPLAPQQRIAALDAATGAVLWEHALGGERSSGPPSFAGGKVYVSLGDAGLALFDPATGAAANTPAGGPLQSMWGTPVTIAGGRAFDMWNWDMNSTVYDAATGAPQDVLGTQHLNPVADAQSFLYVTNHPQTTQELDVSATLDDPVRWWADIPRFGTGGMPEPFFAGPVVYVGDSEGRVVGLALANGNRVFCDKLAASADQNDVVAAGGDVLVAAWAGKLVGYRSAPANGQGLNCPGDPPYLHVEHEPVPWIYDHWNGNTPPGPRPNPDSGIYYAGGWPQDRPYTGERDTEEPPPIAESLAEPIPGPVGRTPGGEGTPGGAGTPGGRPGGGDPPGPGDTPSLTWRAESPPPPAVATSAPRAARPRCVRAGRTAVDCTLRAGGRAVLVRLQRDGRTLASATVRPRGGVLRARLRLRRTPPAGRCTLIVGRGPGARRYTVSVARR